MKRDISTFRRGRTRHPLDRHRHRSRCLKEGLHIKQAEVHGMSQRGGDVQSNLRISSDEILSDLIPQGAADIIISLEPMEALRYVPT